MKYLKPTHYLLYINEGNICIDKYPCTVNDDKTLNTFNFFNNIPDNQQEVVEKSYIENTPEGYKIVREPNTHTLNYVTQPINTSKYLGNGLWV